MQIQPDKETKPLERDRRIENSAKRISKALNLLEAVVEELDCACRQNDWDAGVVYQIEDAAKNLGFALATLNRWYDDDVLGCGK